MCPLLQPPFRVMPQAKDYNMSVLPEEIFIYKLEIAIRLKNNKQTNTQIAITGLSLAVRGKTNRRLTQFPSHRLPLEKLKDIKMWKEKAKKTTTTK